jgi:hypothetical protein
VGVDGLGREISSKCVSIAVIIVSWVDEGSLGADSDVVLLFLGLLVVRRGCGGIDAISCDSCLGPRRGHCWGAFELHL